MLVFVDDATWASQHPVWGILTGLLGLVLGAELLVRGAVWIALTLGMSRMAVGLTLVSIGTSLPELLVTLTAADGRSNMAIANVLGSNIANVLLIVGVTATIRAVRLHTRWLELAYMLLLSALACLPFVFAARLERWMSAIMVCVLAVFLTQLLLRERAARRLLDDEPPPAASLTGWLVHATMLGAGFAMLAYGADWLVDGAARIARDLVIDEGVIGLTVIAIGTSLPELVTSAVAALRGQPEIAVGNVIGSNIFNIGAVLGGAGLLRPFAFDADQQLPTIIVASAAGLLLAIVLRRLGGVPRPVGVLFLLAYLTFTTCMVICCRPTPA